MAGGATSQQRSLFEDYDGFVEKFKPKKTTDDCYTPPEVYEVIKDWAVNEYGIDPEKIVRPFYPGGDYESFDYSGGKVVVDNPPFSILSKIQEFYLREGVPFFLFAPSLTCLSSRKCCMRTTHIICNCSIEYANGAVVQTSFVTNMGGDVIAKSEPTLTKLVNDKVAELHREKVTELPKYEYPSNVLTAAMLEKYSKYGVEFEVRADECCHISKMDEQAAYGKTIFGSGLLMSDDASNRFKRSKDMAERVKRNLDISSDGTKVWTLSDRERAIVDILGKKSAK